jgi:hypothetical protein
VPMIPGMDSSSPIIPRETILDRAFQLRCIPGLDRDVIPGEEKLSSLARFDALMRDADERRKRQEAEAEAEKKAMQSAWDLGSSDEDDDDDDDEDDDNDEDDEDNYAHGHDLQESAVIPPSAQRALQFIAGRHGAHSPGTLQPGDPYDADSRRPHGRGNVPPRGPLRPHTAHAKSRPNMGQRTQSQPQLALQATGSSNMANNLDVPSSSSGRTSEDTALRPNVEKRQSNSSVKRLSFTEFTKRLSSTSSLLLVQTNTSAGSSRGSSEIDNALQVPRGTLNARGAPPPLKDRDREEWEKRCGWRGSVGVFGSEGGFL